MSEKRLITEMNYERGNHQKKIAESKQAIEERNKAVKEQVRAEQAVKRLEDALSCEKDRLEQATRHLIEAQDRFNSNEQQYQQELDGVEADLYSERARCKELREETDMLKSRLESLKRKPPKRRLLRLLKKP